jgi:hypothetical protein
MELWPIPRTLNRSQPPRRLGLPGGGLWLELRGLSDRANAVGSSPEKSVDLPQTRGLGPGAHVRQPFKEGR